MPDTKTKLDRKPIGHVIATVKFALYEGDHIDREKWAWFEFAEPGIIPGTGKLAVCTRKCETLEARVEMVP